MNCIVTRQSLPHEPWDRSHDRPDFQRNLIFYYGVKDCVRHHVRQVYARATVERFGQADAFLLVDFEPRFSVWLNLRIVREGGLHDICDASWDSVFVGEAQYRGKPVAWLFLAD